MMIYGGEGGWSVVTGDTYGMRGGMVDGGWVAEMGYGGNLYFPPKDKRSLQYDLEGN
jgi:hypothetical protein